MKSTDTQPKAMRNLSKRAKYDLTPKRAIGSYSIAVQSVPPAAESELMRRPTWNPKPWVPVRPGAEDHKQWKSRGM